MNFNKLKIQVFKFKIMRKFFLVAMMLMLGVSVMAQQRIQLRSADRAECTKSDMRSLKASFSFSTIEAEDVDTQRGQFSWLSMPNTVIGGNEGDPQIPVVNELIAVPFGAQPTIRVTSYSSTDYRLNDLGIQTLVPRQPSLRKDQRPEDVPFVYNANAYQTRGMRSEPQASVRVVGTMRGVQLGKMTIEPVSYDPVNNTLRVFNDIEVEVSFDGADAVATEKLLVDTYSPYFDVIYNMLFNGRSIRSAYDDHPDLYTTPVKMLVVTTSTYVNSTPFQNWLAWKKQKGIDVNVQTVTSSTSSSNVRSLIQTQYNATHPTFLVIVGDETAVKYYTTWTDNSLNYSPYISDNAYASIDSDVYHDMFMSRMSVSSTTELGYLVDKILMYEQYTMPDPSYLNNVLLIAGADGTWAPRVGRPTINYAANYYFNTAHGFSNVYKYVTDTYTGCYNYLSSGVGFANYTAHGDIQEWYSPNFTNTNVNALTNTNKYFWAMGNCCLTANWGNSSYSPCYGEAMIRAQNKGAFGYIGSIPESYWWEDYYFGVGATSIYNQTPTQAQTTNGVYDMMFDDAAFNTLNAVPFAGNVAVTYAHANNYTSSVSDEYYWRGYQCLGDGSVMPYHTVPAANNVSHSSSIVAGTNSFRVNADAGSYVAITVNNNIIGVAAVPSNATYVDVPFTTTPVAGQTAMIVVTRNQRQPYINAEVPVINNDAPQYTITANVTPSNSGTVEGAGTYYENTNCTLTATANTGYGFTNWTQNGSQVSTNPSYTFTVTGNATYTANFHQLQQHHITYTAQQSHGTIGVSQTEAYMGDVITLTATPDPGYSIDHWTVTAGGESITVANNQFTMPDSDVTVSATFKSEPLTVADGTGTNSEIPFYGLYADDNYQHTQTIYPSSMLSNMQGCQITKLTYYLGSSVTKSFGSTFQVRLGTTTNSAFSSGTVNYISMNGAAVYSGTLSVSGTTVEFDFSDNPYLYSGGNLVVDVRITALGSGYQSMSFYGESGSTYYSVKSRSTSSLPTTSGTGASFMPKTTFAFTAPTTDPYISLAPNAATILTGFTQTLTATCGNVSGTPGITYTSSNSNVATVVGNGTTATVTAVAPGTATITATMTYNGTTYTATCAITVEEPAYCEPSFSSPSDDYIKQFVTTGGTTNINNTSTYVSGGYSDYYSTQSASIGVGETLSCTVTPSSTSWKYGHAIWVDWNKDYEFTSDERVAYTSSAASGNWTGSVAVPANTNGGDYRMRVIHYYNQASPSDPCVSGQYGEAEDYKLTVIAGGTKYTITATANPTEGGTVTGAGQYYENNQCTLNATPNDNYVFANWTKDGAVVSTNATYSFTVTEDATYVANFDYINTVVIMPNDPEYGSVAFGGNRGTLTYDFEDGWQNWTTFQGSTTSPHSWMHNTEYVAYDSNGDQIIPECHNSSEGMMLSESYISASTSGGGDAQAVTPDNYLVSPQFRLGGSFTFYVASRMSNYPAEKFSVLVSESGNNNASYFTHTELTVTLSDNSWHEYTIDLSEYSGMGYVAIRHYDCNDQHLLYIDDVTIVEGEVSDGSLTATYVNGTSCTVIATPNEGYYFANWTEDGAVVSSDANYTFEVTDDLTLVANFTQEPPQQTYELSQGLTWWSTNLDITLNDLKAAIETALGSSGTAIIKSQTTSIVYSNGNWIPESLPFDIREMYKIQVSAACELSLTGVPVNPSEEVITIYPNNNWIGFPSGTSMTVDAAFADLSPVSGDIVKSQGGSSVYNGSTWVGSVSTLEPGQGYLYYSKATSVKTFTFGTSAK